MTSETVRQFVKRQPFQPFIIQLTDGRSLEVRHPDFVVLPPGWNQTAIVTFPEERFEFVYIRNIAGIESAGEAFTPPTRKQGKDSDSEEE